MSKTKAEIVNFRLEIEDSTDTRDSTYSAKSVGMHLLAGVKYQTWDDSCKRVFSEQDGMTFWTSKTTPILLSHRVTREVPSIRIS